MAGTINLDAHFRRDSAARTVAERLLTGKPQTRQELTDGLGISVTTVNRVVEMLQEAGAKIIRETADDGRQAQFRVVEITTPRNRLRFPTLDDEVEFVGAWKVGDATMVDMTTGKGSRYRGQLMSLSKTIPLGKHAVVKGISRVGDGLADLQLESDNRTIQVHSVQNITEE